MEAARIEDYPVGTRCDVLDNGTWRTAKVLEVDAAGNRVLISFENWASNWDCWVEMRYGSARIAPLWTKVEKGAYTGDPKNPPDPGYDLSEEENQKEFQENYALLGQIKDELAEEQPLDEKRVTWLCQGKYALNMLRAKVSEKLWQKPYEYLQLHLYCILKVLQRGLKQADEDSALDSIKFILGHNDQTRDDIYKTYYNMISGYLSSNTVNGKFAAMPQAGEGVSPARILLINEFGEMKGFDVFRSRLHAVTEDYDEGRKGRHAKGTSFMGTNNIIQTLRGMKYLLHPKLMTQYFASLKVDGSSFIGGVLNSLNRDQIYAIAGKNKKLYDSFIDTLSSLIRGAQQTKTGAREFEELAQLDLILFFIRADKIVAQRRGMQLIQLYLKVLNPKKWDVGDKVTAQFKQRSWYNGEITAVNEDGTYNVRFDDGDTEDHLGDHQIKPFEASEGGGWEGFDRTPTEEPPKLEYLKPETFITWLEDNKVIDLISADARLFLHSSPIFKFLASQKQLTNAHLDILLSQAKTAEGSELMSQLAEQMDEKTLTMMYKRQTEGIDYSEYQPWQLDALTKFTLSAVKATNGAHYYGLNLFWDMLKPENESKLTKEITKKATACLNMLFESDLLAPKKEEYINACVKSLTENSGEVNALTVFQILMKGLNSEDTAEKIEGNIQKYDLLTLFFKNSEVYNAGSANFKPEFKEVDGKQVEVKVQDRVLTGVSTHRQQVWARLNFLRFLCSGSRVTLEAREIDEIWKLYVTSSVSDFDTESFMRWLPGCLKEGKELNPVFSPKSRAYLFSKLASKHTHTRTGKAIKVTPEWQHCFISCFLSTNRATNALERSPLLILDHSKLEGMDQLWEFALKETDDKVRSKSQKFLGSIYIKFSHKDMSEKAKIKALDGFVATCMKSLYSSADAKDEKGMQAVLELLNNVLNRINVGEMIKRPLYKKGEKIKAHWKKDGGTLYVAQIVAVNEDGTYHLHYSDGDVDKHALEAYLREENGHRRVPEPVKLTVVEQHIQVTLADTKEHFNRIFSSLDVGGKVGALAWDLLKLLPPSDSVAKNIRGLDSQTSVDFKSLLSSAPVKLLYSLQIMNPAKLEDKKNPLNSPKWCATFAKGGLQRLAQILKESASKLVADKLALLCLAMIYKIFIFFLQAKSIAVEDVLKVLPVTEIVSVSLQLIPSMVVVEEAFVADAKATALKVSFELLATFVQVQPKVFAQIKAFGPEWEKVVPKALIVNKNVAVQKSFTDGMDLICTSHSDDSAEVAKEREGLRDKLLEVTNVFFAELDTETNCAQYLLLMRNLIANTEQIEAKSAKDIGLSLAQLIKKHPMTEASPKAQDHVLGALLNLTAELIKKVPSLRETMGSKGPMQTSLLKPVYEMLFTAPTLQNSYHLKIRPPQCKHPKTRSAGFSLLAALASNNDANLVALASLLLPHHRRVHSNGKKPYSWDFEPAWMSDVEERQGYCGLVNCGNTCYINAALQQVFMQPKLRENILSIGKYDHPNPGRPHWKRDELEGLQWLLGYLQESNKRAIHPMFFHSRFEDPDWENQGKPVRGDGAAGHAQADSNGFLQTLLGRVEDRIKKYPQKDAIKDVCGLQFTDQIVGTRAAPYLNYNYSVDNWVGPISLNVQGHKSLHECLKSHVEFKQQNRKVSKEGVFGQKYEKQNVQVWKRTVFKTMPQCLMICLNRMGYDNFGNTLKLNHRISFPIKLDMKPYSEEALYEKLPRGTDSGQSASAKDQKTKIEKPSEHPDEYYQYELMGIIVHAGRTLQSGHYYSYIRERPPGNRWYCFNDSHISEFNVNKLEEETFGSADTDSWKCSTAYVLVYDKIPLPAKVSPVAKLSNAMSKLKFADAGMLVTKLQKKKGEASEKVKARAVVPQGMLRKIWDENELKWRDSNAHDRAYGAALRTMLTTFRKAHPAPPESQPAVEKVTDEPANFYDQITRFVTRYLFVTLARSKGKIERGWKSWVREVASLYKGNVASSVWLLSMFVNPSVDWFSELVMAEHDTNPHRTPAQEVRFGAVEVLAVAMETIAPSEKRAVTKAAADPSTKRRVRTMTPRREMMEIEGKGKQVDEKLDHDGKGVDKKDAPEVVPRPPEGFLLSIVARTVAELQATTGDNSTASYHWIRLLCKFGSFYPEATKYLESTELFEDLYGLVEQKQEYGVADKIADQLPDEYFSLVFLLTKAPEQVEKLCQSHFLNRLLLEGYTVARAKPICALVKKLCAANKNVLKAIMNLVGKAIGERHHEITRPLYRVLTALVLQKDAADAKLRPALIMGGLCAAYANNELKYKEGDFLAEQIIRLAETSSDCAAWLQKAKAGVNLVLEFLQNRKEEKKQVWNEGDQVVARYKHERGVYAGDVMKCHGDDTYYIQYDDGDVWDRAPGDKIRPRLMPRLNLTEGLDTEAYPISGGEQALHPQTVKTLQFVLKNHSPRVNNELPELTGILDEVTVFALQDLLRQSFEFERSGKLDEETIKHLQYYLDRNFVSQQKNPMKEYPDQSEMFEPDGVLNPLTKFFVRKWLGLMVTTISTQQAKEELEGHVKQHVAERDEIGFHKKGRLYTITCEFAPYGRSVAEKVTSLQKILKGEPLASGGYDSEDEREGREFKVGQSVDAWDDYFMRWKVATVSRVTSDTVTVKFERTGSRGDVDVQYSYDVRRPKLRARFHTYPRADPHVLPEAGKFSKLYK